MPLDTFSDNHNLKCYALCLTSIHMDFPSGNIEKDTDSRNTGVQEGSPFQECEKKMNNTLSGPGVLVKHFAS